MTQGMRDVATWAVLLANELGIGGIVVRFIDEPRVGDRANYGGRVLTFNVAKLGVRWFEPKKSDVLDLILHEFGHEYASNHLDEGYYRALTALAVKAVWLAVKKPEVFT